jgi:hypothetical protein
MMSFRDRAKQLGMIDVASFGDLDVWLYILKHQ